MAEWRNGGMVIEVRNGGTVIEWRNCGMAEWRNCGTAEWWNGNRMTEMVEWRNGGMAEWRNGENGGTAERMAEWQNGRNGYIRTIYGTHTHTDDDDINDDDTLIFCSIDRPQLLLGKHLQHPFHLTPPQ
jgi:hypothetical protein